MQRNLATNRPDIPAEKLGRLRCLMNSAVPLMMCSTLWRRRASSKRSLLFERAEGLPNWFCARYHRQYLFKVPDGYCGIGGTGVACPVGLTSGEA
ncbi:hypothetical protein [Nonomuraea sp. NPDC023979]|uniref:hypothetical protein n=1 Tax=Nonomuraea sp. NPDC023979 TaxID=3154796 RepID=UPI0033FEBD47